MPSPLVFVSLIVIIVPCHRLSLSLYCVVCLLLSSHYTMRMQCASRRCPPPSHHSHPSLYPSITPPLISSVALFIIVEDHNICLVIQHGHISNNWIVACLHDKVKEGKESNGDWGGVEGHTNLLVLGWQ